MKGTKDQEATKTAMLRKDSTTSGSAVLRTSTLVLAVVVTCATMQGASLAFALAFSTRFYGGMVMKTLMVPIALAESSAALALLLAISAYVLDITYWPSKIYRRAAASTIIFFLVLAALCAAEKEPGLPIGLYIVGMP